jgi:hypothetical protein
MLKLNIFHLVICWKLDIGNFDIYLWYNHLTRFNQNFNENRDHFGHS